MPVALISTRTSPAFGPSRSTSTISSGFLASNATAARVFIPGSSFALQARQGHCCAARPASSASSLLVHAGIFGPSTGFRLVFLALGPIPPGLDRAGAVFGHDVLGNERDGKPDAERHDD